MKSSKTNLASIFNRILAVFKIRAFCNVAEGTHSGHITMTASSEISQSNLLVKISEGGIAVAGIGDTIIGVCTDCGDKGDVLDVALAGSAESTILCVASTTIEAGKVVYSDNYGKISSSANTGAKKIGVALNSAEANDIVEVDPQGFGQSPYNPYASGVYLWDGSTTKSSLEIAGLNATDCVIASLANRANSEKLLSAKVSDDESKIEFTLDANGTAQTTAINWIVIKNA